jgi:Dihydrodipicolinate reductase, N-terminus.
MNTAIYGYGTMGKFLVESVNKYEGMTLAGVVDDLKTLMKSLFIKLLKMFQIKLM